MFPAASGIQVQGQSRWKAELDSRQAARKGDPAVLRVSQREDLALTLHCVQPQEHIEYFEDGAPLHYVRNLSLTQ